ncbi:MAG: 1-acyl-sn-glycerol-3-phosphate acyltransferase [Gemmataceae bacterium]|nr:1-acyl-sn-glycerol-3-phosphate acyltransferase [Gemmataceae bacterium]MDW8264822.1 lysophospholipid acyltransferase family protein [Gemmataceae bacterium]
MVTESVPALSIGWAAGMLTAWLQRHPRRRLGVFPVVLTTLGADVFVRPWSAGWASAVPSALAAALLAYGLTALATAHGLPRPQVAAGLTAVSLVHLVPLPEAAPTWGFAAVAGLTAGAAALSWWLYARDVLELALELLLWPVYRFVVTGPGLGRVPLSGPLLVYANHTAYTDPFWVAKVIPRRLIPMMTSVFYDKPIIRWLMAKVVHAIRIEASSCRREAPELRQGIEVLDRGGALLIFPEGWLRRVPEPVVRRFGRGIWHILRERPQTPIVACWIEGGWGSYLSYFKGPPGKNKRLDWWRPIAIAVGEPFCLSADILQDHRLTRTVLMERCVLLRRELGLEAGRMPLETATVEAEEERDA